MLCVLPYLQQEENVEETAFDEDEHYCGEDPEFWSGGNKPHKFDEAKARGPTLPPFTPR
jgi:hypothetical protein